MDIFPPEDETPFFSFKHSGSQVSRTLASALETSRYVKLVPN